MMFVTLTVVMSILCVGGALEPGCRPWGDSPVEKVIPFRDTCYVIFAESLKLNWDEAKNYCDGRGGMLAKVLDHETDEHLSQVLPPDGEFLIGVSRQKKENGSGYEWIYTDGAEVEFSNLHTKKFPNYRDSDEIHVIFISVWRELKSCFWYIRDSTDERRFMCQYTRDAVPDLPIPKLPTTDASIFPNTALTTRKRIQRRNRSGEIKRYQLFKVVRSDAYILPMENILRRPYSSFQCCSACLRIADCVAVNYAAIGKACRMFKNISVLKNKDNAEFREGWNIWAGLEGAELLRH